MAVRSHGVEAQPVNRIILLGIAALAVGLGVSVARYPAATAVGFLTLLTALLSWYRPAAVIALLAFYIPIEEFLTFGLEENAFVLTRVATELVLWSLLVVTLARKLVARRPLISTPLDGAFLAFVSISVISALVNLVAPLTFVYGLRQVLRYAVLVYIIANAGLSKKSVKTMIWVFLIAASIQIVVGLAEFVFGAPVKEFFNVSRTISLGSLTIIRGREIAENIRSVSTVIFGTLPNYNAYGVFIVIAWLTAYGMRLHGIRFGGRAGSVVFLTLGFICVLLSYSRSSMLVLLLGLAAAYHMAGYRRRAVIIVASILIGLAGLLYLGTTLEGQEIPVYETNILFRWARAFRPSVMGPSEIANYRLFLLLVASARVISESPLLGLGPGTFGSAMATWSGSTIYHRLGMREDLAAIYGNDCNWATIVGQVGLLGLASFIVLIGLMISLAAKTYRRTSDPFVKGLCFGHVAVVVAISVGSLFAAYFEGRYTSYYMWMGAGAVIATGRQCFPQAGSRLARRLLRLPRSTAAPTP